MKPNVDRGCSHRYLAHTWYWHLFFSRISDKLPRDKSQFLCVQKYLWFRIDVDSKNLCYYWHSSNIYWIKDRFWIIWIANCDTLFQTDRNSYNVIKWNIAIAANNFSSWMLRSKAVSDWEKFQLEVLWIKHTRTRTNQMKL